MSKSFFFLSGRGGEILSWRLFSIPGGPNWESSGVLMVALGPTWEPLGLILGFFSGRLGPHGFQLGLLFGPLGPKLHFEGSQKQVRPEVVAQM